MIVELPRELALIDLNKDITSVPKDGLAAPSCLIPSETLREWLMQTYESHKSREKTSHSATSSRTACSSIARYQFERAASFDS